MKKYNMTLHLSNIRDALSVAIPAASLEDALAQIHAGDGVKLEAKEESLPGRCYDVSRVYIENIHVPAVLLPIKSDADILGQQFIFRQFFIPVLFI